MNLFDKTPKFIRAYKFVGSMKVAFLRFLYRIWGEKKFDVKDDAYFVSLFIKNSVKSSIYAAIIALVFWFLEPCFTKCVEKTKFFFDNYVTILVAVAAIETLFIGLYYAGLTSVASVAYSKVPYEIRSLLIEDRVSSLFMRFATISSVFVYIMLGKCLIFDEYSILAFGFSIVSAILIIPSFLFLGKRLFNFFSPINWVPLLRNQLERQWENLHQLSQKRFPEDCAELCKKQGWRIIRRFECLSQILISESKYSKRELFEFDREIIDALQRYQVIKSFFPTNSRWYGKKHRYKSVVLQDYMRLNIMFNFQNQMPLEEADDYWFEDSMEEILFSDIVLYANDVEFTAIVPEFGKYIKALAYNNNYDKAHAIIDRLWSLKPAIFSKEKWAVSFIENIFIHEINLIVYLSNSHDKRALFSIVQEIEIDKKESFYKHGFSMALLKDMELFNAKVQTELKLEGNVKTPHWYVFDILCQQEAIRLNDNYKLLTKQTINRFENRLKDSQLHPIYKAAVLKCIQEYWAKLFKLENQINSIYDSLVNDVKNPIIAFENLVKNDYKNQYVTHLKSLTIESANVVPLVSVKERDEEIPDYAGMLILKMFDDSMDFAIKGDCSVAEKCITNGLVSIFLRTIYAKNNDEIKEFIDYAILISSVFLICSEYYQSDKLMSLVDSVWNKQMDLWFKEKPMNSLSSKGKEYLFASIDNTKMGMSSQIVKELERKIITLLENVSYEMKDSNKTMLFEQYADVKHESPLIRHLVKEYRESPRYACDLKIEHLFIIHYFMKSPYLQDCDFGWENECLKRDLEGNNDEEE